MTPFDRSKATPGGIDISTAQKMHVCCRIATSFNLPRFHVISLELSFVNFQGQFLAVEARPRGGIRQNCQVVQRMDYGAGCHYDYR